MNDRFRSTLTPGMIIGQRYEMLRPVRSEIHGQVWLARDQVLDVDVGLKYLANDQPDFDRFLEYYRREALWGLKMHHPQVLGVHHLDESGEGVFLLQEPFTGNSLWESLGQSETLSQHDSLYFLEILAQGLASAHKQGISHQNFNPRQVLVSATDGIKIINFAFPAEPADLAAVPELQAYIPPEVWEGKQIIPAGNLFSLGVMGYQMLTGTVPFPLPGEGPIPYRLTAAPAAFEQIPEPLRPLFSRCLKAEPERRFKSASEFLGRLAKLQLKGASAVDIRERSAAAWTSPSADPKDRESGSLKILPMEPEVEINPDWQEPALRPTTSSWAGANAWVANQQQRFTEYFGAEPLRRNRRKQIGAAIGGAVGLLLVIAGLSSLFSPSPQPNAVVRTAGHNLQEGSPPASPGLASGKPPVMSAAPVAPKVPATEAGTTPSAPKAAETAATGPEPLLPEPATAVKPTAPVTPVSKPVKPETTQVKPEPKAEKPLAKPVVKTKSPPAKPAAKPAKAAPSPVSATATAAKTTTGPKLLATLDKEAAARQKADALTKQGQKAVVKKAKKGQKTVYQVWLSGSAAASRVQPRVRSNRRSPIN